MLRLAMFAPSALSIVMLCSTPAVVVTIPVRKMERVVELLIFSYDATMPRNKASVGLWIETLETFLAARPGDDALRNRIAHLR